MKNILQVGCSKKGCEVEATEKAILYGKSVPVCLEHKRTTDLGNWQGIKLVNTEDQYGECGCKESETQ